MIVEVCIAATIAVEILFFSVSLSEVEDDREKRLERKACPLPK